MRRHERAGGRGRWPGGSDLQFGLGSRRPTHRGWDSVLIRDRQPLQWRHCSVSGGEGRMTGSGVERVEARVRAALGSPDLAWIVKHIPGQYRDDLRVVGKLLSTA